MSLDRSTGLAATIVLHLLAAALVLLEVPPRPAPASPEPRLVIWIVAPTVAPDARAQPISASPVEPVTEPVSPPTSKPNEDEPLPTEEVKALAPQAGDVAGTETRIGGGHGDPFAGAAPSGHFNTAAMRPTLPTRLPGPEEDRIALAALKGDLADMTLRGDVEIIVQVDADGVVIAARDLRGSIRPDVWRVLAERVIGRRLFHASDIAEPVWRLLSLSAG